MWGLIKAHSLTGKLSRKHAFLDVTWGHADEMTELHSVNKYTLMCCIHMLEAWGACRILETRFGCSLRYLTGVIHPATKMIFQKEPADTRGWKCSSRQDRGHICIPTWGDVHENDCFFYNFGIIFAGIWTHSGLFGFRSLSCPAFKARLPSCYCLSLFTRLSGNFYNSCAETQLKTREQHHEKTFKRPGWSAYWNSSRETALFPLSSCKLRSPFRVQWRSRSHSFSLSLFFWTHGGMGWTSAEPENSSDHWTNALQACALQAPHMWPPEPCQVKSRTPEFCQHTCRTSRLLSCPFSGWITGFSDRGRKIQTQTYNHCDKLEFLKLYSHDCSHVRLYFKLNSKNQHASNTSSYLSEKEVRHCLLKWHISPFPKTTPDLHHMLAVWLGSRKHRSSGFSTYI